MKKERIKILFYMLLFSFIGLTVFSIHPYVIILLLISFFAYDYYTIYKKLQFENEKESNELKHEIKLFSKDSYLKHKQLFTMVSNMPFPLALLDGEGKIVLYNKSFMTFRNHQDDRKLDYLNNDCVWVVSEVIKDSFLFEKKFTRYIEYNEKTYEVLCEPVTTKGKFSGCLLLFQDISEAKEKEEMQKQFIADASHELKTPISVIKGMTEILNRDDFDDKEIQKDFLNQIGKETQRMEFIVKDLLQLSRLSMKKLNLNKEVLDVREVLDDCINSQKKAAQDKGLTIEKNYLNDEKVYADRELSKSMFTNLISNAIKYSDKGIISISTLEENGEYVVSIKDEGVGISSKNIEKIFDRFYRIDKARSRSNGGSGLGLSIVKSIVEAHGARIEVKSEENDGTEFKIYFRN